MIKGKIKSNELTRENILSKISSYDIYRYYFGDFTINEVTCNHLRGDTNPSFIIGNKKSIDLTHTDFGNLDWRGDCFHLVKQIFRCDFDTALRRIDKDFNLGISEKKDDLKTDVIKWSQPKEIKKSKPPFIQFIPRKFNKLELAYWSKLRIGEQELKAENVFVPKELYINRSKVFLKDELCFIYYYPKDNSLFKSGSIAIYKPYEEKDKKWFKNVSFTYVDNLDKIENCDTAFLCKSKKESLLFKNLLQTDCIATIQAENPAAITDESLEKFLKVSKRYVIGDNDKTGKQFTMWLTQNYEFQHINVEDKYLNEGITDFADMVMKLDDGYEKVENYFINKGII